MIELFEDIYRIGLTALFNPVMLFLLVVLFFLGRFVGWMTRGLNIWKFIALGYFGIFLFRPLQDAGLVIGGIFVLGVASMYLDLFRDIFRWSGSFTDIFYAMRSPNVYRDIDRLEREVEELKRQMNAAQQGGQSSGGGNASGQAQSATQAQWRSQAKARAQRAGPNQAGGTTSQGTSQHQGAQSGHRAQAQSKRPASGSKPAGEKEKRRAGSRGKSKPQANASTSNRKRQSGSGAAGAGHRTAQSKAKTGSGKSYSQKTGASGQKGQSQNKQQQSNRQKTASTPPPNGLPPALRDRYLTILELTPGQTYSPQDLKAAWRVIAFKTHPDQGGSAAAFNEAHAAYKALR